MADDVGLYWTLFQGEFPGESIMYALSLCAMQAGRCIEWVDTLCHLIVYYEYSNEVGMSNTMHMQL